jgi:HemY protein
MKRIIFYFFVLLFAVWLGVTMHQNPGYVLIAYKNISVETSMWFAIVSLIVLFLIFYAFLRFSSGVCTLTSYIRRWISNRRKRRAEAQTVLGLYDFVEGNWERSEKKLLRSAKYSSMPLINYLAAAFVAQRQRALKRRDNYLYLAQKTTKDRPIAVGLVQASLQIGNKQWEEASITLQSLYQLQPRNVFVLQLLEQVYLELKDWHSLEKLLPILRKRSVFSVDEINQLEEKVYKELLMVGSKSNTIVKMWHSLPRYLQRNSTLVAIYVEYLLTNNQAEEVETTLKMVLRKNLDDRLLELYAKLSSANPIKQLLRAEKWLQDNPENPSLLLCLGHICREQKLWGKARHYLEKSARLQPSLAVYAELAQMMIEQNDLNAALEFYDKGVHLSKVA